MDSQLNAAADVLTALLAEAEKQTAQPLAEAEPVVEQSFIATINLNQSVKVEVIGTPETIGKKAFCTVRLIQDGIEVGAANSLTMTQGNKSIKKHDGVFQGFSDSSWNKIMDAIKDTLAKMPKVSDQEKSQRMREIQKEKAYEMLQTEGHGYDYGRFGNDSLEQD
jgi:hypothetical protein